MKLFSQILCLLLVGQAGALAQTSATTGGSSQTPLPIEQSSGLGNPAPYAGVKSYNTSGRLGTINDAKARILKSKNEVFLGLKTDKGWGLFGQATETLYQNNDDASGKASLGNKTIPQDPSLTIMHPIYKSERLTINGSLREYFPVTDFSVNRKSYQQAYYLNLTYKMPSKLDLFNQLIPRYFSQSIYKPTDTLWYAEDFTTLTTKVNSWFRYGIGQHAQLEVHSGVPTGSCLEVYPMADFMISNTIFAGPRLYFPVAAQNTVNDGPTNVSTGNIYGEIYLQATL